MLAWRDLADVEAGGSEVHAATVAALWAEAGLEVTMRTSYAQGQPPVVRRDGYRVVRRAGRYLVFPRAVVSELRRKHGEWDAIVEIWNGVPFFTPLWSARRPHIALVHHLHAEMWRMVLPENPNLARAGELFEARVAPLFYRRTRVVTLSPSSKRELVEEMGLPESKISVVPPGIDAMFTPGGKRSAVPLVVAAGRFAPVKQYDVLIRALDRARAERPDLQAVIVGDGYDRYALEALIDELDARAWIQLPGRISTPQLIALYRQAWLVAAASVREGWGMTITEAAACGTPAVATRISGHADAVIEGETGLLVEPRSVDSLAAGILTVVGDDVLRKQLGEGALEHARQFTWERTATGVLSALADEASRSRRR